MIEEYVKKMNRLIANSYSISICIILIFFFLLSVCESSAIDQIPSNKKVIQNSGPSANDSFAKEILEAHNKYRKEVNVPPLIWSITLSEHAQEWANRGVIGHDPDLVGEGENIWWGSSCNLMGWSEMVDSWGAEKKDFKNSPFDFNRKIGHYTQIIWANTTEVGCGQACKDGSQFFVCRYSPAGNLIGGYAVPIGTKIEDVDHKEVSADAKNKSSKANDSDLLLPTKNLRLQHQMPSLRKYQCLARSQQVPRNLRLQHQMPSLRKYQCLARSQQVPRNLR